MSHLARLSFLVCLTLIASVVGIGAPRSALAAGPSAHCHVTDGSFTTCPDGSSEWSDIPPISFPATNAYLYADQAQISTSTPPGHPDTLVLLYDECGRRTPLGANEYLLVNFPTVETEEGVDALKHYSIHIFGDGTIVLLENNIVVTDAAGQARSAQIEALKGSVGFGPSPNCVAPHAIGEFQIPLSSVSTMVEGSYSPDPLFWSSDIPPDPPTSPPPQTLPDCPDAGSQLPVTLAPVDAPITTTGLVIKGYSVTYGQLPLTFTSGGSTSGGGCQFQSNQGSLPVYLNLLGSDSLSIPVATSTTTANISFLPPGGAPAGIPQCDFSSVVVVGSGPTNCFINGAAGPNDTVAVWSTPGFSISVFGAPPIPPVPSTFYVNISQFNNGVPMPQLLQNVETYIHQTLIGELDGVQRLAFLQDPPSTLLVKDPNGKVSGIAADGTSRTGIPLSHYVQTSERSGLVIVNPVSGTYTISMTSSPGTPFNLSMSAVDLTINPATPAVLQQTQTGSIATGGTSFSFTIPDQLNPIRPGFSANQLPGTDDGSTGLVPLPFTPNFFGTNYSGLYVNNNGNLTFTGPLGAFTPFGLSTTGIPIIAPFFADVYTIGGNVVTYGPGIVNGHLAFGANWPNVGCYVNLSVTNNFQVILIDRSDIATGDFDIEFNYGKIEWEAGEASGGNSQCLGGSAARVGYSNGSSTPGTFFELSGSGVPGAFLDSNLTTGLINNQLNSDTRGRYLFEVRAGTVQPPVDTDHDGIPDIIDNCPTVPNPTQVSTTFNGIGDACDFPAHNHTTAAFLQANLNGSTSAVSQPLTVSSEPTLTTVISRIVQFRLDQRLTASSLTETNNLVSSLVAIGQLDSQTAAGVVSSVLGTVTEACDVNHDGHIDIRDVNLIVAARGQSATGPTDPRDPNRDGVINALDARICVTRCDVNGCAVQ